MTSRPAPGAPGPSAKQVLRRRLREARRTGSSPDAGAAISRRVVALASSLGARVVALYVPVRGEVDVTSAAGPLADDGVTTAWPLVDAVEGRTMSFRAGPVPTSAGAYGIPEPPAEAPVVLPDLLVVPGLAFDVAGGRLGSGAGFYDRWLAVADPRPWTAGVCDDRFLLDAVPTEPHDVAMDEVLTERRHLTPRARR